VRIPASLCGIVGFKPSRQRVPTQGAFPLSFTLDSIGPLASSVTDCAKTDAVMAGEEFAPVEPLRLAGLRLGLLEGVPLDNLDDTVAAAFAAAVARLDEAGVLITREEISLLDDMAAVNAKGGIPPAESCAIHRERIARRGDDIDPHVRFRIEGGCAIAAADYVETLRARERLIRAMDRRLAMLDALIMPTTPLVAPTIAEVADTDRFFACHNLLIRNTAIGNFFDLCAISLPLQAALPVGLMLVGRNGTDHTLLRIAAAIEQHFRI
jgi:aspartyl-tRNA(Asn)/glutamyl-tRNA(Gln) amidotransferase subunit A